MGFTLINDTGHKPGPTMSLIQNFLYSVRNALTVDTQTSIEERYLSDAVDHVDLERRIATQSRAYMSMAPMNIGR